MVAGDAALGAMIKDIKEQLRALPDPLTYGMLRYLNTDIDLAGPDPRSGSTTWDVWAPPPKPRFPMMLWRISQDGSAVTAAATAMPMPMMHTVELNAVTVDTGSGPQLHATWTWAPSASITRRSAG